MVKKTDELEAQADEKGVSLLAEGMRRRLAEKRAEGRGGWHDPNRCDADVLASLFFGSLQKPDVNLVDLANFLMMLFVRGGESAFKEVRHDVIDSIQLGSEKTKNLLQHNTSLRNEAQELHSKVGAERALKTAAEKECEKLRELIRELNQRLSNQEQNLSRALGYIDRVNEGSPVESTQGNVLTVRGPQIVPLVDSFDHRTSIERYMGR